MKMVSNIKGIYELYLQGNLLIAILMVIGLALLFTGYFISVYNLDYLNKQHSRRKLVERKKYIRALDKLTSFFPLKRIKKSIRESMEFNLYEEDILDLSANIIVIMLILVSLVLAMSLKGIGQLWYVKIMIFVLSFVLPYYIFSLALDINKFILQKKIPQFINQFISAFTERPKVKYALLESSKHIDKKLGRIIYRVGDSSNIEGGLLMLKEKFNSIWLNIFVVLILNHKTVGGDLIDQLYKLNASLTKSIRIEKKKSRRLILYEAFAVGASILSIPAIIILNNILLGSDVTEMLTDTRTNIMITRIIILSVFSLILIRVLRKL